MRNPDVVLVPALGAKMPDTLAARLELLTWARRGRRVAAVVKPLPAACTGTFLLAESALLDGQRATTSWWLAPMFRQRYPRVAARRDSRMLVNSDGFTTAGAALAHLDLALGVIAQLQPGAGGTGRALPAGRRHADRRLSS